MPSSIDISVRALGLESDISKQYANAQNAINRKPFQLRLDASRFPLGRITGDVKDFEKSVAAATNRVVAFGLAAGVFTTLTRGLQTFIKSTIEVENSLARINVNLGEGADGLKRFSAQIFEIARNTGTTFEETAKAAEELARQGLSAEETAKRLKDALILARIAGLDTADSVKALTSAVNTFSKEGLTTTDVVNRFAAVDTRFAVSSKDLSEAISRVGSSAQEAGINFNQLLGIVTAVQQSTQRGGATIGNSLKTIFTRISRPEALEQLEQLGIITKDVNNNLLPGIQIIQNLSAQYDKLSQGQKSFVAEQVGGVYQINILKAAVADLNKQYSTYGQVLKIANEAGDSAIQKNEQLNSTLKSLINSTSVSIKELFSSLGNQQVGGIFKTVLHEFDNLRKAFQDSDLGQFFGNSILKGVSNVLTGPVFVGLVVALGRTVGKIFQNIGGDIQSALGLNVISEQRAVVQDRINKLLAQSTISEQQQIAAATSLLERKEAILRIAQRITAEEQKAAFQNDALAASFIGKSIIPSYPARVNPKLGLADGFIPSAVIKEQQAISKGIGGASFSAKPVIIPNFAFGNGKVGPIVANTDEYMVKNYAGGGSAILNPAMIKSIGLPNGAKKIGSAAGGYVPNAADAFQFGDLRQSTGAPVKKSDIDNLNKLFDGIKSAGSVDAAGKFTQQIQDLTKNLNKVSESAVIKKIGQEFNDLYIKSKIITNGGGRKLSEEEFAAARNAQRFTGPESAIGLAIPTRSRVVNQQALKEALEGRNQVVREKSLLGKVGKFANNPLTGIGISIAAPLAAGFLPQGQSGTASGIGLGAASGGLQGAGIGAIFGPIGIAIGAGLGALVGSISKASKSIDEISEDLRKQSTEQKEQVEEIANFVELQKQYNESLKSGTQDQQKLLSEKLQSSLKNLSPETLSRVQKTGFKENELSILANQSEKDFESDEKRRKTEESLTKLTGIFSIFDEKNNRDAAKNLATRATEKGVDLSKFKFTNDFSTGENSQKGDFLFRKLGLNVDLGKGGFNTNFVEAIRRAAVDQKNIKDAVEILKKQTSAAQQLQGLDKDAFTTKSDLTPFSQSGQISRFSNQFTTKFQKADTRLNFFKALESQGAFGEGELERNPEFRVARGVSQRGNLLETISTFLQNKVPGFVAKGANGSFLESGITRTLTNLSSNPNNKEAQILLQLLNKSNNTISNLQANPETRGKLNPNPGSQFGYQFGGSYTGYAGSRSNISATNFLLSPEKSTADKVRAQDRINNGLRQGELNKQFNQSLSAGNLPAPVSAFAESVQSFNEANLSASDQVTKALKEASETFKNSKIEAMNNFAITVQLAPETLELVTKSALEEYATYIQTQLNNILAKVNGKPNPPQNPTTNSITPKTTISAPTTSAYKPLGLLNI